jgi:hypothetical protein
MATDGDYLGLMCDATGKCCFPSLSVIPKIDAYDASYAYLAKRGNTKKYV